MNELAASNPSHKTYAKCNGNIVVEEVRFFKKSEVRAACIFGLLMISDL